MEPIETVYHSNFKRGAYSFYQSIRHQDPIFPMSKQYNHTSWLITRYDDVKELLKSQSFIKDQSKLFSPAEREKNPNDMEINIFQHMMLDVDPPDHTRLRRLVQPFFNPKSIRAMEPRIQTVADTLIEEMRHKDGPLDLIDDFAFPLPIIVISELLGVPAEDRNSFRQWSNTIVAAADEFEESFIEDVQAFSTYLTKLFEERRNNPQDDLISKLLQAEEEGEKLHTQELYSMVVLLIIAGHETTVNLIANTMYALFQHPDQLKQLKEDHSFIESAIEEGLRFYSPVDFSTARWAGEDMSFRGKEIKRGDFVVASLSSANRDEAKFEAADTFDITRKDNQHLAFGLGIHFCLGAPLARLEGKIALQTLFTAFPYIHLAPSAQPKWKEIFLLRGLEKLEVELT
ncbi:cytochrome P450 [Pontibacillus salicampi]|uniref:Cytochrome P450 n=1 Tax=Pontibacillus salicampi TaxID=1449801 RepID=A0ABV6LI50_9BACI